MHHCLLSQYVSTLGFAVLFVKGKPVSDAKHREISDQIGGNDHCLCCLICSQHCTMHVWLQTPAHTALLTGSNPALTQLSVPDLAWQAVEGLPCLTGMNVCAYHVPV